MIAGVGFYSYYIHQGNKSDKERKIVRKRNYAYKKIEYILLKMVAIPCGCNLRLPLDLHIGIQIENIILDIKNVQIMSVQN